MGYWQNNDADYWRREHDDKERELSRLKQDQRDEIERQRQEMRNHVQEAMSTAESWEEAFRKAIYRFGAEVRTSYGDASVDDFFKVELTHAEVANSMLAEYEEFVRAEIAGVIRKRNQAMLKRLKEMFPDENSSALSALEQDDFSILVNW